MCHLFYSMRRLHTLRRAVRDARMLDTTSRHRRSTHKRGEGGAAKLSDALREQRAALGARRAGAGCLARGPRGIGHLPGRTCGARRTSRRRRDASGGTRHAPRVPASSRKRASRAPRARGTCARHPDAKSCSARRSGDARRLCSVRNGPGATGRARRTSRRRRDAVSRAPLATGILAARRKGAHGTYRARHTRAIKPPAGRAGWRRHARCLGRVGDRVRRTDVAPGLARQAGDAAADARQAHRRRRRAAERKLAGGAPDALASDAAVARVAASEQLRRRRGCAQGYDDCQDGRCRRHFPGHAARCCRRCHLRRSEICGRTAAHSPSFVSVILAPKP